MARRFEQLYTLAELARLMQCTARAAKYRVKKVHAKHGGVIVRLKGEARGRIFVRRSGLMAAEPGFFAESFAPRAEVDELHQEVAKVKKVVNALAGKMRERSQRE